GALLEDAAEVEVGGAVGRVGKGVPERRERLGEAAGRAGGEDAFERRARAADLLGGAEAGAGVAPGRVEEDVADALEAPDGDAGAGEGVGREAGVEAARGEALRADADALAAVALRVRVGDVLARRLNGRFEDLNGEEARLEESV